HELQNILEQDLDGYPEVELPTTPDWLADHVRNGARTAHQYYETCIEHYDLAKGVRNPPAGLDQELKDILAELIGLAAVGFARLLERGFDESQVQPPEVELVLDTIIAQARRPVNWVWGCCVATRRITTAWSTSATLPGSRRRSKRPGCRPGYNRPSRCARSPNLSSSGGLFDTWKEEGS
ncbi:MAG TPA: hypothetical protein P5573_07845, partial [Syntrophales bacterium]|nr:hypothetical protein [Syntrophales bacterium]